MHRWPRALAALLTVLLLVSLWPEDAAAQTRRRSRHRSSRHRSSRSRTRRPAPVPHVFNTADLLAALDPAGVAALARNNRPDGSGALGRNQAGYVHVRFQAGVQALADQAARGNDGGAVAGTVLALTYAFNHQQPSGDFELTWPPAQGDKKPGAADLASGTACFLASAGLALVGLESSTWLRTNPVLAPSRARLDGLKPAMTRAITWLMEQRSTLLLYDGQAPNRLLLDAVAFAAVGQWLGDTAALRQGRAFAYLALARQAPEGFFREGDGFESSYQGVSLALATRLLALLPEKDPLRAPLKQRVARAAAWLSTRVKPTGELSTAGNTLVRPGGDAFLGEEKQLAWTSAWQGLRAADAIAGGTPRYRAVADRVARFYRPAAPAPSAP